MSHSPRTTDRDLQNTQFVLEHRAMFATELDNYDAWATGRIAVCERVRRHRRRRMELLGLIQIERIFHGLPPVLTATRRGAHLVGRTGQVGLPEWSLLQHTLKVPLVGLHYLRRGHQWTPDAELVRTGRASQYGDRPHRPDGIAAKPDGTRVAVEVELTAKSVDRTLRILDGLMREYDRIDYWVGDDRVHQHIGRCLERMPLFLTGRVELRKLEDIGGVA